MPPKSKVDIACEYARACKTLKKSQEDQIDDDDAHVNDISEIQNSNQYHDLEKTNAADMVLGSFLSGTSYQACRTIIAASGKKPSSRSSFFEYQATILPKMENLGDESTHDAMKESVCQGNTDFSQDSRWSSHYNGLENTNAAIDAKTGKVVSVHNTLRSRTFRETSFNEASNMMESEGLRHIANDLKENYGDQTLAICHDGDNKSPKVFNSVGLNVEHHRDGGHALNSIKNAFKAFKKEFYIKYGKRPFGSLDQRIFRFAGYLFSKIDSGNERVKLWKNAPNHFVGDHTNCSHPRKTRGRPSKNPCMVEEDFEIWHPGIQFSFYKDSLQSFFDDTSDILFYGSYRFTTTRNESFNATVNTLVPKRIDFRSSYSARTAIAIGRTNDPDFDEKVINTISPNINPQSKELLLCYQQERNQMKEKRSTTLEKNKRKKKSIMKKRGKIRNTPGDYNEKKHE